MEIHVHVGSDLGNFILIIICVHVKLNKSIHNKYLGLKASSCMARSNAPIYKVISAKLKSKIENMK